MELNGGLYKIIMKRIFQLLFLLLPFFSLAQQTETETKTAIDGLRTRPLTPAGVGAALDILNYGKQSVLNNLTASGTNTYTLTASTSITEYKNGLTVFLKFTNANTLSTVTLNINSMGAKPVKNNAGSALAIGDLAAGGVYVLHYDGTEFRVSGAVSNNLVWGILTGDINNQTDLQSALSDKANRAVSINTQTSNYTLQMSDRDTKAVLMRSASAQTLTVPPNSSVAFPIGTLITVFQDSTGALTIAKGSGVEIESASAIFTAQDVPVVLLKKATNTWLACSGGGSESGDAIWGGIIGTLSNQTDLQNALDSKGNKALTYNTQTGSSYTLVLSDKDTKAVLMRSASNQTLTVPADASVAFPVGTVITVVQDSTGILTISNAGGVVFENNTGTYNGLRDLPVKLVKKAANRWYVFNGPPPAGEGGGDGVWGEITGTLSDQTDLQSALNNKGNAHYAFNVQTGSSYTMQTSDTNMKAVLMRSTGSQTLVIPTNAAQSFPVGAAVTIVQDSTGALTIVPQSVDVILESASGGYTTEQDAPVVAVKKGTNRWYIFNGRSGTGGGGGTWGSITGTLPDQTDLQGALNLKADEKYALNIQTGSAYTLQLEDKDTKAVLMRRPTAQTLTVPTNASVAFPIGTVITVFQDSTGVLTFTGALGVHFENNSGFFTTAQDAPVVLIKKATDTWLVCNGAMDGFPNPLPSNFTWNAANFNFAFNALNQYAINASSITHSVTGQNVTVVMDASGILLQALNAGDAITLQATNDININAGTLKLKGIAAPNATDYVSGDGTWRAIPGGGGSGSGTVTSVTAVSPLTGGTITTAGNIGIQNAAADATTKGAASFETNDFNAVSGNIAIDYANGQKASASVPGFVSTAGQTFAGNKSFTGALILPNKTPGRVLFTDNTSEVNVDPNMEWDFANAKLNVGQPTSFSGRLNVAHNTTAGGIPLTVSNNSSAAAATSSIYVQTGTNTGNITQYTENHPTKPYGLVIQGQSGTDAHWGTEVTNNLGPVRLSSGTNQWVTVRQSGVGINKQNSINANLVVTGSGATNTAFLVETNAASRILQLGTASGVKYAKLDLGSDATGDLFYRNSSGNLTRLGIGTTGQVLTVAGGLPSWGAGGGGGGDLTDGDKGDITVTGSGTAWTIDNNAVTTAKINNAAVTLAKIQDVTTARFLGRTTAGTGVAEQLTGTQATAMLNNFTTSLKGLVPAPSTASGRYLEDDGTWSVPTGLADGNKGPITVAGDAWSINNQAVTMAKIQNIGTATLIGRTAAGTGVPSALTAAEATSLLNVATTSLKGLVPAPGTATGKVLSDNMTWITPSGGGGSGTVTSVAATIGNSGTAPNISGSPITSSGTLTVNIPNASATNTGTVTTGAQTLAGAKTFSSAPNFSTMTSGSVLFAGTSGALTQDNTNFSWNNSNKSLRLQGSAGAYGLQVARNVNSSINMIDVVNTSTGANASARANFTSGSISGFIEAKHGSAFSLNSSSSMRINATGALQTASASYNTSVTGGAVIQASTGLQLSNTTSGTVSMSNAGGNTNITASGTVGITGNNQTIVQSGVAADMVVSTNAVKVRSDRVEVSNGSGTMIRVLGTLIQMYGLPTSASGLPSGTVWRDGTDLKIVP